MIKLSMVIVLLFCLTMFQCVYNNEEELYPNESCEISTVSFAEDVLPLVQTNCAISGCHVAGTGRVAFTGYEALKMVADDGRLAAQTIITRSMPPNQSLSNCEIELLKVWIDQGALNN